MGASQRRQATAGEEGARERGQREELLAVDENRRSLFLLYYVSFGSIIGLFWLYTRSLSHVCGLLALKWGAPHTILYWRKREACSSELYVQVSFGSIIGLFWLYTRGRERHVQVD